MEKKLIKKILQIQKVTLSIYLIVYLCVSFCFWEFYNPFEWIINIPKYTLEERFFLVFGIALYYFFIYNIIEMVEFDKKKPINEEEDNQNWHNYN